ncbi:MAG: hypothetical protein ABEI86_14365 [Halobacteriaceae archaeon]
MQPSDFENHSDRVSNEYNDEISYRSAISRKYYFIFHLIREQNRSYFSFEQGDHGKAKKLARQKGGPNLADDLDDLRDERNRADYDIVSDLDLATFEHDLQNFILEAKRQGLIT